MSLALDEYGAVFFVITVDDIQLEMSNSCFNGFIWHLEINTFSA